jgi:hypothetical protein
VWQNGAIWKNLSMRYGHLAHGIPLNSHRVGIEQGVERVRTLLHSKVFTKPTNEPIWLHNNIEGISRILMSPKCVNGIKEAGLYCYPKDRMLEGNKPSDKWNHFWKAAAYGCVGVFGYQAPWMFSAKGMLRRAVYGMTSR